MSEYRQPPLPPQFSTKESYAGRGFDENEYQRRQDEDHLRLLSIFHYVMAAFMGLTALYPLIYVGLGIMLLAMPESQAAKADMGPGFMAIPMIVIGSIATIIFGAVAGFTIKAGIDMSARRGLTLIQIMACISCLYMPLGTILGVFTLIVVNRPSVRRLFERRSDGHSAEGLAEVHSPSYYDR